MFPNSISYTRLLGVAGLFQIFLLNLGKSIMYAFGLLHNKWIDSQLSLPIYKVDKMEN